MKLASATVQINQLLLDPNNYRFMDDGNWRPVPSIKFAEAGTQDAIQRRFQGNTSFGVDILKESIAENGFIPLEQIVVKPWLEDPSFYVVVEGNRRIAALKLLLKEELSGSRDLSENLRGAIACPNVLVLDPSEESNKNAIDVIMAIRHVSGIKEWGAYQQARLIVELMGKPGATFAAVGRQVGMSATEVGRRHRAAKALKQMQNDDEYSDHAVAELHGLFQETFASTQVRDWLQWDRDSEIYKNRDNLEYFYSWITSTDDQSAKIHTVYDVRKLSKIIKNERALDIMKEPSRTLVDAVAAVQERDSSVYNNFESALRNASAVITSLSASLLRSLTPDISTRWTNCERRSTKLWTAANG